MLRELPQAATEHLRCMSTDHLNHGLEPLLTVRELSSALGVPVGTIYDWRTRGEGPVAHRFGKHLKFAVSDVRAWMDMRRDDAAGTVVRNPHHRTQAGSETVVSNRHHRSDDTAGTVVANRHRRSDGTVPGNPRHHLDGGVR